MTEKVVIVGGGQAAVSAALRLRAGGYAGKLDIIGEEPTLPYQRPPLSKKYLKGEIPLDRLHLRPEALYRDQGIALHMGKQALFIDRVNKKLATDKNQKLPYDKLILATGATPRRLPDEVGGHLANVHTFRTLAHADGLQDALRPGKRLLIIGGGYIGLEMAAVAVGLGLEVTLIEFQERILNRVAAPETADWFRVLHLKHGVDLREGVGLERLIAKDGRAHMAQLSDGSAVGVDLVIAGIGVLANDGLARSAGLTTDNGIVTDQCCRTFDPDIYAIGDCAVLPFRGEPTRLESVQNACDQGDYVADHILGVATSSYDPEPWFWSDQYDISLKIAGLNRGYDNVITRRGERDGGLSVWYFAGDKLLAVDALDDPKSYMMGKKWLSSAQDPDPTALADPEIPLKSIPTRNRAAQLQVQRGTRDG
ncbi:NAD(P)/FAD-dependent oxidoreductase [Paracoccus aerodenitrificans]|uniref:NAD(P)/FAD-dependent oxidoreductase n=1 Tax=Paracoccus aerodenitrificans TaxID=3017781 RepID=UPI0022EFE859|nr:FAD-dependent oxidoreductase [Paracoccus aerodenitrificans]WBU63567.1 FAD-dependent oxidoreductase [Paracoccus aerodenitrificans]